MPHTRTFSMMELSPLTYAEIREKLILADYEDQILDIDGKEALRMDGITVVEEPRCTVKMPSLPPAEPEVVV